MSNIYVQEPPTEGKVVLETSVGEIDIELWSKECPKACRNFVQLCMEGYYDKTKFFRVVPEFIVQGGDPTNTGTGGESIWGKTFKDEFHSRLRFVRRGLVAMANAGKDDNGSQFFFTLAATKELQNKHTIFGKVAGDTIYNMIRLGQGVIEDEDRPKYPHKIIKAKVLVNPFPDIEPRAKIEMEMGEGDEEEAGRKKKSKMKATKNFSLLSFGEEAEEDEADVEMVTKDKRGKGKSAHDLAADPKLSSVVDESIFTEGKQDRKTALDLEESEEALEQEINSIRNKLKKSKDVPSKQKHKDDVKADDDDDELDWSSENPFEAERQKKKAKLQAEAKALSKELKNKDKKREKEKVEEVVEEEEKETEEESNNDMLRDYHKKQKDFKKQAKVPKDRSAREQQTLALLAKFKNKLSGIVSEEDDTKKPSKLEVDDDEDEDDISGDNWMKTPLVFETDGPILAKDANTKDDDWFDIYDPRNKLNKRRRERDAQGQRERERKEKMMKL